MAQERSHQEGKAFALAFLFIFVIIGWVLWHRFSSPEDQTSTDSLQGVSADLSDVRFWSAAEVRRRQTANEPITFLDTRSAEQFSEAHILDSIRLDASGLAAFEPEKGIEYVIVLAPDVDAITVHEANDAFKTKKATFAFLDGGVASWEAVGGSVYTSGDPTSPVDQSKVYYISVDDAYHLLSVKADVGFLDIRNPSDFRNSHIPGAINIPLSSLEARRKEIPRSHPFIVYGSDELSAFQGAVRLFDMRFFGPRVLKEGYPKWVTKTYPVEK